MLRKNGIDPVIMVPEVEETLPPGVKPHNAVMFLALKKALYAEGRLTEKEYSGDCVIIAADTTVVCDGCIIGKPNDMDDARDMLKRLRGKAHTVYTGVAMIVPGRSSRKAFYEKSAVFFGDYKDEDIEEYIKTGEPYDKAGGYAVQGAWGKHIDRVEGSVNNVIGFPIELVLQNLGAVQPIS